MNSLKDKVTIITGAVGNLGAATARLFQQSGSKTVLVDRSPDRVREAYRDIADSADHLLAGGIDLSDAASLGKLLEQTLVKFGRVDALVNTVGGYRGGKPVHEADLADWDFLFNINVRTTVLCCRAVIPQMLRQSRGTIINDNLVGVRGRFRAARQPVSTPFALSVSADSDVANVIENPGCNGALWPPTRESAGRDSVTGRGRRTRGRRSP